MYKTLKKLFLAPCGACPEQAHPLRGGLGSGRADPDNFPFENGHLRAPAPNWRVCFPPQSPLPPPPRRDANFLKKKPGAINSHCRWLSRPVQQRWGERGIRAALIRGRGQHWGKRTSVWWCGGGTGVASFVLWYRNMEMKMVMQPQKKSRLGWKENSTAAGRANTS